MKNKIVVIGPSSTHVSRFIHLVRSLFDEVIYIGEERLERAEVTKQYQVNFRSKNPFNILKNYRRLKEIIQLENPNLVHIQQVNRVAFMASFAVKRLSKKYVITTWGSDVLLIPAKSFVYKKMVQRVLNNAASITADSHDMLTVISKLSPNKNSELVFLGIDPIKSLPKEKFVFSNRSHFELYNINKVILEFYEFQKSQTDWKLVIAGTGEKTEQLKMLVQDLKISENVEFVGWLTPEKNNDYYKRASIYISLPSSDGTSVSLLEAMSAGCIPIVSDLPVAYEWIDNGKNGIIKNKIENAIAAALQLNAPLVERANVALIENFATGRIATEKFKSIYEKLKQ